MKRKWKKLPQIKKGELHVGCLNCSTAQYTADMSKIITVGFGSAVCTKDGELVFDGERYADEHGTYLTFEDAEHEASKDPDHDWRVIMDGPLHGETYQRHGHRKWVCVESNEGFA